MAEKKDKGKSESPQQDYIIGKLIENPASIPFLKAFRGFVGKSDKEGITRLYITPEMNEYIEVKTSDVVHSASTSNESNPLGGSVIWLNKEAMVEYKRMDSKTIQAEFLEGEISKSFSGVQNIATMIGSLALGYLRRATIFGIESIPPNVSVCSSCPTGGGEDSCVPATCTLSTGCQTQFLCPEKPKFFPFSD